MLFENKLAENNENPQNKMEDKLWLFSCVNQVQKKLHGWMSRNVKELRVRQP